MQSEVRDQGEQHGGRIGEEAGCEVMRREGGWLEVLGGQSRNDGTDLLICFMISRGRILAIVRMDYGVHSVQ